MTLICGPEPSWRLAGNGCILVKTALGVQPVLAGEKLEDRWWRWKALSTRNASDVTVALLLLERAGSMRHLMAGKGYDTGWLRHPMRAGTMPVILGRRNRKRPIRHHRRRYRGRHLIKHSWTLILGCGCSPTHVPRSMPSS